jgi:hypothetical protein
MSSVTERGLQANGLAFNVAEAGDGPRCSCCPAFRTPGGCGLPDAGGLVQ